MSVYDSTKSTHFLTSLHWSPIILVKIYATSHNKFMYQNSTQIYTTFTFKSETLKHNANKAG